MQENTLHQHPPANLIVALLEFFSNVMLGIKGFEFRKKNNFEKGFLILFYSNRECCSRNYKNMFSDSDIYH